MVVPGSKKYFGLIRKTPFPLVPPAPDWVKPARSLISIVTVAAEHGVMSNASTKIIVFK